MAAFEINLLQTVAGKACARKAIFWSMVAYLTLCIVVVAWFANSTTHRLLRVSRLRREIDAAEQAYQTSHRNDEAILEFAERAKRRLESDARTLETIEALIRSRISLVNMVSALTVPLPGGVNLLRLDLDGNKKELTFAVVVPEGAADRILSGGQLAATWNEDTALQTHVGRIRAVSTRRERVDGRSAVVFQFAAKLK